MAKNPKQSSDKLAGIAGRIMQMARDGGPIEAFRPQLREALRNSGRDTPRPPRPSTEQAENETADMLLEAIREVLQPYFDEAESLAASVVSQADGPEEPKGKKK